MTTVSLNILGCVSLSTDHAIPLPPASALLLGCLALHATAAPLRRERLAEMLWPDMDAHSQKARLRTALWRLKRSAAGALDAILHLTPETVALVCDDPNTMAHALFEDTVLDLSGVPPKDLTEQQLDTLVKVVDAYHGPLLEGHDAPWLDAPRMHFSDLYSTALEMQIAHLRATGRDHETIRSSHALLALDPYREDIHAALIALYGASGRPARAVAQYERCQALLEKDLGVASAAARATLDAVLKPAPPVSAPTDLAALLGKLEAGVSDLTQQIKTLRAAMQTRRPRTGEAKTF